MYFRIRNKILFRQYDEYGYITDNSMFGYRMLNDSSKILGEKYISQSGAIILSTLSQKPQHIDKIIENREETKITLKEMGFTVLDSKSNFIFASHPDLSAKNLYEELKNRGILVRYFGKERIKDFVRITVGNKDQMQKVTEEIKNILKG